MITQNTPTTAPSTTAHGRSLYQAIQVAGLVAPLVGALSRTTNLDAIWVVAFPFHEMAHPSRPTLKLSAVIKRAEQAAVMEQLRVDSLESAKVALLKASHYSDWTERAYAPLFELLDIAIADKRARRLQA
jgi:hypothetical protein